MLVSVEPRIYMDDEVWREGEGEGGGGFKKRVLVKEFKILSGQRKKIEQRIPPLQQTVRHTTASREYFFNFDFYVKRVLI